MDARALSLALACVVAACSSSGGAKSGTLTTPARHTGFPPQAFAGIVFAEARLYVNHEDIFDDDLIDSERVVPVALKIGLRGEGQDVARVRISPEDMEFCLYLPDGTPMRSVEYQKVKPDKERVADHVIQEALKGTLLEPWERSKEGFVFFKLPDDAEYSAGDRTVTLESGDVQRRLELSKSLCTFKVTIENQLVPFNVGIQQDRRTSSKR